MRTNRCAFYTLVDAHGSVCATPATPDKRHTRFREANSRLREAKFSQHHHTIKLEAPSSLVSTIKFSQHHRTNTYS